MIVYLSGPMTGMPDFNRPAFRQHAEKLREQGYTVVNPADLDAQDDRPMAWEDYLRRDLAELVKCDAIALMHGWENSRGARLEQHVAAALSLKQIVL